MTATTTTAAAAAAIIVREPAGPGKRRGADTTLAREADRFTCGIALLPDRDRIVGERASHRHERGETTPSTENPTENRCPGPVAAHRYKGSGAPSAHRLKPGPRHAN
ncbi:hypothetical protein NS220_05975 [Microbacterium testaceum]|uniref:Uncharacterized protein n=1 Tax=Microbacterium testaceum TaxID=2033 RepID=A0A147EYV8_MICTE|nr:hypothetical protein NS220_05975 [Microbacterium testaceum]